MDNKPSGQVGGAADEATAVPMAGKTLAGRYQLQRKIGQGGMGAVYAAQDLRLGRKVAVKLLLDTSADFAARFEREARAASRINHPNCVAVHDFGTSEDGSFLVLEWVDGRSLAEVAAEHGGLPPARAAALLAQVCDGLFAAHAAGVIHRDVKPENVMVHGSVDGLEIAKLLDFGIARVTDGSEPKLTQTGNFIGSPFYMSPEQSLAHELDPRTDLYSAGATLFFALTARPPYVGERGAVMMQHINADLPALPLSLADHPLAAVVRRAMSKRREERYPTAAELARAIREAGQWTGASMPRSRQAGRMLSLGAGAAALVLATAVTTWKIGRPAQPAQPEATAQPKATAQQPQAAVQPPPPAPEPAAKPTPPEPTATLPGPPREDLPGLEEARRLAASTRRDSALAALARLRQQFPRSAEVPYLQGQVNFRNFRWNDGLAAYRAAIGNAPALRSDPALIKDVIRCLDSDRFHGGCEAFLLKEIGGPALPHLAEAARADPLVNVQRRARRLEAQLAPRSR